MFYSFLAKMLISFTNAECSCSQLVKFPLLLVPLSLELGHDAAMPFKTQVCKDCLESNANYWHQFICDIKIYLEQYLNNLWFKVVVAGPQV